MISAQPNCVEGVVIVLYRVGGGRESPTQPNYVEGVVIVLYRVRGGRKSPIQFGDTKLRDRCKEHTYNCIICKQNPFKIILRGSQGSTPADVWS